MAKEKNINHKKILSELIKLSLFLAVAFLFTQTSFAQKTNRRIENLDVQGNRRLKDTDILQHIKTRPGQILYEQQLEEDLKNILALGWFDATSARVITEPGLGGGINIIFEIRELPVIEKVSFKGLESFTEEQITTNLRQQYLNIEKGDVFNVNKIRKVRLAIKKFLNERGFFEAKVTVFEEEVSATSLKLNFFIEEHSEN